MSKDDYPPVVQGVAMSNQDLTQPEDVTYNRTYATDANGLRTMITIEELRRLDADDSGLELLHSEIPVQEFVKLAISQHEEIERLRAALQEATDCLWINSLNAAARKAEQALKSGEPK